MGAQMVHAVEEVVFTDDEDSIVVTLSTGRVLELFGDGFVQEFQAGTDCSLGSHVTSCACKVVDSQI